MTTKEAIQLLKSATMFEPTLENRDYPEAFDLAIKALEERPQGDLISREALKKAILEHRDDYIEDNFFWSKLFDIIDNAPTVHHPNCDICEDKAKSYSMGFQDGYLTGKERPQGEWIFMCGVTCGGYYKCSNCGEVERAEKNYCPNCGALMMKGGKEE